MPELIAQFFRPRSTRSRVCRWLARLASVAVILLAMDPAALAQSIYSQERDNNDTQGPIRLRQPTNTNPRSVDTDGRERDEFDERLDREDRLDRSERPDRRPATDDAFDTRRGDRPRTRRAPVDEFEAYARRLAGQTDERDFDLLRRFGAELITGRSEPDRGSALAPPDYLVGPGDQIQLVLWGSVDADLRVQVDRSGRINIPRVGSVTVAGVRYGDLPDVIRQRVAQVFRNFQLSVSLGQLRGVRVYVTGFAQRPGSYNVSSLSTIVGALLRAGGPAAAGSFRDIQLRRGKQLVTSFDLYDLLLKGDRSADRIVQADDVIHIGPVGTQVALIGSVNKPAIFELKAGDTVADVLAMAGGFTAVADRSRLGVQRLEQRSTTGIAELPLPQSQGITPSGGDVLRAFSSVEAVLPVALQNRRVRVEGEVANPGEYVLPAQSTINDALQAAGGLTAYAYVFGTEFSRESVRITQQENYERALRDLETEFAKATTTQRALSADEAATQAARGTATTRLIERLRTIKPSGRIVLQSPPETRSLPDLALEDGDRVYVPARPTTVGIFGSVFNSGSYLYSQGRQVNDFVSLAGGPTRGADPGSTFVLRANGSVVSARQRSNWLGFGGNIDRLEALAGDTVFVPEEINKTSWTQELKEWSQIFYQFGLGAAAIRTLQR